MIRVLERWAVERAEADWLEAELSTEVEEDRGCADDVEVSAPAPELVGSGSESAVKNMVNGDRL
jgi:hypothetical protein